MIAPPVAFGLQVITVVFMPGNAWYVLIVSVVAEVPYLMSCCVDEAIPTDMLVDVAITFSGMNILPDPIVSPTIGAVVVPIPTKLFSVARNAAPVEVKAVVEA